MLSSATSAECTKIAETVTLSDGQIASIQYTDVSNIVVLDGWKVCTGALTPSAENIYSVEVTANN